MAVFRLILAAVCVCVAGCGDGDKPSPANDHQPAGSRPTSSPPVAASEADLSALIAKQGSVTFRSFGGKWIGTDVDTDLTFLPHGAVHMFEYGVGVSGYHGTYAIDSHGSITLTLPTFGHAWPAMSLLRDATSLFLVPAQDANGFVMGNRGGVTFAPDQGTNWPFRPLEPVEEAQVREAIQKVSPPAVLKTRHPTSEG